jgi:hypothetical protein
MYRNYISRLRCTSLDMTQANAVTNQKLYYFSMPFFFSAGRLFFPNLKFLIEIQAEIL